MTPRVLVTGATGFTGGHLARRLKADGYAVRALARPSPRAEALRAEGFDVVIGDLADAAAIDRAVAGCQLVFHVAALYRSDNVSDQAFFDVNVEGTRRLLAAAQRHQVQRVIHTSTAGVHGHIAHPPADETAPLAPRDAYQQSKCQGEEVARQFFRNGLCGTIVRPVGIFGPGDTRFLKLFRTIARGQFMMLGDGRTLYHMTYIDNLIDGLLLCARHPAAVGETFLIAGAQATTLQELVARVAQALGVAAPRHRLPLWPFQLAAPACQAICRALGVEPPLYPRRLEFFSDNRAFTIDKARRLLGYQPQIPLDEGLRRTAQWYRAQGWL